MSTIHFDLADIVALSLSPLEMMPRGSLRRPIGGATSANDGMVLLARSPSGACVRQDEPGTHP
jgi:hypothetical protein